MRASFFVYEDNGEEMVLMRGFVTANGAAQFARKWAKEYHAQMVVIHWSHSVIEAYDERGVQLEEAA